MYIHLKRGVGKSKKSSDTAGCNGFSESGKFGKLWGSIASSCITGFFRLSNPYVLWAESSRRDTKNRNTRAAFVSGAHSASYRPNNAALVHFAPLALKTCEIYKRLPFESYFVVCSLYTTRHAKNEKEKLKLNGSSFES